MIPGKTWNGGRVGFVGRFTTLRSVVSSEDIKPSTTPFLDEIYVQRYIRRHVGPQNLKLQKSMFCGFSSSNGAPSMSTSTVDRKEANVYKIWSFFFSFHKCSFIHCLTQISFTLP
jgi:hypothetical protein